MLDLTIVVVNWNTYNLLYQNLESIYHTLGDLKFEVIVVDNASTDGSSEMVQRDFPQVRLFQNRENIGFARANNQAIRQSYGRFLFLLNSDAYLTDQACQKLVSTMEERADVGIVGAGLYNPDGSIQDDHGVLPILLFELATLFGLNKIYNLMLRRHTTSQATGWVKGAAMMLRRETLDQIGLLDEGFFMFSEEIDLCYRAKQAGWKVFYVPEARVIHMEAGSTGQIAERVLRLYRGKLRYYQLHHGETSRCILFAVMLVSSYIKVIVYSLAGLLKPSIRRNSSLWETVVKGLKD